ncbi:mutS protein homolog 4-like [Planococcus citri]|uniref:mutS protein homolog 4-like n=1 Tax=Planococcus citri TaxID=170843 RepID=UPI0031F998E5
MNIKNWGVNQDDISFDLDKDFLYSKNPARRKAQQAQNQSYENKMPSLRVQATQYVTRDGLPTKLALNSSISSPFVQRSNIRFPASFNSRFNNRTETPRDIFNKYAVPIDGGETSRSTLDFSNIFKVDFGPICKPLLPQITENKEGDRERSPVAATNTKSKPSKLFFSTTVETKTIPPSSSSIRSNKSNAASAKSVDNDEPVIGKASKSATSAAPSSTNHTIIAIIEGRGQSRGEVGIAAVDVKRPFLILCQINDTQTYMNTLRKINILNPVQILVPNSFCDKTNKLYQLLLENFPRISFVSIQRKFFNDSQGLQQVQGLCLPEYSSVELIVLRKTHALMATAALIRYSEFEQSMMFAPKSVRIEYQSGDNIVFIDLETSQKLELVISQSIGNTTTENTLYSVLNNCCTIGGQRRLRSLILQPSTEQSVIEERLDCVTEMIETPELFYSLKALLPKFLDIEQLLCLCTQIPNVKDTLRGAEIQINNALLLKTSLEVLPALQDALKNAKNKFFQDFVDVLGNPQYKQMTDKICEVLNDDSRVSKSFVMSQFQRCFAIKTGINGFLDIARLTYSELLSDFNEVVENLIKEYRLPLVIRTLRSKGSVLQMRLTNENKNFNLKDLPPIFIQVQKTRSLITMTTKELLFLKERMNHFIHEIELLSSSIIFNMLEDIRPFIGSLYKLCECIAELDVIMSFAQISKNLMYVKPKFSKDCTDLKASLHPILNHIAYSKPVANDIFLSTNQNFCVITGPNMGGKSVYIRQIVLLQIMAQIGCYVPADSAQFRITDRIFARIGFNDKIECNASSFILEMKEMQYIMNSMTPTSLIIIDELCRGTSTEEGSCIAWAICEKLLATKVFVFFTTHFLYLTKLQDLYCNVVNYHFEAIEVNSDNEKLSRLIYTHRLVPGVLKLDHYGLKLARSTALPEKVLDLSENTAKKLASQWKVTPVAENSLSEDKQIDNIVLTMVEMLKDNTLTLQHVQDICEFAISLNLSLVQELIAKIQRKKQLRSQIPIPDNYVTSPPMETNHDEEDPKEDSVSDYEMSPEQSSINSFRSPSPRPTPVNYRIPAQDEESMEYEPSEDENLEPMSQFSTSSIEEPALSSNGISPQMSSLRKSTTPYSATPESSSSAGNVTLGFVMQRKVFEMEPMYDDKFWRMNETTFTFQSIRKSKKKNAQCQPPPPYFGGV